jgi:hypothetical protein
VLYLGLDERRVRLNGLVEALEKLEEILLPHML